MKIYIIVEKETGRFVSAHKSDHNAFQYYREYLSEKPADYYIILQYTI